MEYQRLSLEKVITLFKILCTDLEWESTVFKHDEVTESSISTALAIQSPSWGWGAMCEYEGQRISLCIVLQVISVFY